MGFPSLKDHLRKLAFQTLDFGGLALAFLMALFLLGFGGFSYFLLMCAFYVLASFFTFFGAKKKGLHSLRAWKNVLANGAIPTIGAIIGSKEFFFGSLVAVAADKLAGEVGQLSNFKPVMITAPWKKVSVGTNGGITLLGEAVSILTGAFFGILSFLFLGGHAFYPFFVVGILCGFLGSNFDSFLGSTLENKGFLSKHGVNFLASVFGGVLAVIVLK